MFVFVMWRMYVMVGVNDMFIFVCMYALCGCMHVCNLCVYVMIVRTYVCTQMLLRMYVCYVV